MKITSTPIDIIFADDQPVIRKGFRALLEDEDSINIVAVASNADELFKLVGQLHPDVVFTDVRMPLTNGIEATFKILEHYPETAVIAFTMFSENYQVIDMLEAGALGYLLKDAISSEIVEAIHSVYRGQPYYCTETRKQLARLKDAKIYDPTLRVNRTLLSNRERQVLILICKELNNQEIADELKINIKTVEIFRRKLYMKLNCKNMAGLVKSAIRLGIFDA